MLKKILKLIILVVIIINIGTQIVNAENIDINNRAEETVNGFYRCMNESDEKIYSYIDTSNTELYENVKRYLHGISIIYEITDANQENDIYHIKTRISAQGAGWTVSGFTVNFDLKLVDNEYVITNTNLFDVVGMENVFKFVFKIFAIIGGVFLTVIIIVLMIIVFIKKREAREKSNN